MVGCSLMDLSIFYFRFGPSEKVGRGEDEGENAAVWGLHGVDILFPSD